MDTVNNGSTGLPAGPVTNEPVIGQSDKPGTDMATPAPAPAAEKEPENRQETKTEGDSTSTAKDVTVSALAAGDAVEPSPKPSDQPSQPHDQPSTPSAGQSHSAATAAAVDVKAEASEHPNAPEASTSNIQKGYVLVAHPDAAGPSGINRTNNNNNNTESSTDDTKRTPKPESFPQDVNDHNNDENGREVEHYDPNTPPARIQAYARLEFPFFNFYIQKLSVTIGRRPPVSRGASVAPKLQQLDAEPSSVPVEQRKDADEADKKVSPKAEEKERPDGEETIKVKTEEVEKDEQQPSSTVVAPSAASDGPTVKPEETPRKMNTWEDAQQSNAVAGPSSPTAPAPTSQTALLPSLVNDEPASQVQPASQHTIQANPASQADQPDKATTKSDKAQVDVDLGPIKAVSRNHARLFFDSTINSRTGLTNSWSLEVKGRNGLVLDGKWRAKGEVCRLKNG